MKNPLAELDGILRATRSALPQTDLTPVPTPRLVAYCAALGACYGLFVGVYALSMKGGDGLLQLCASTLKVPLLFLLTLCVTFPSMYVLSALAGSRLDPARTLSLLLHSLAITLALAASFAPILGFFTLSTTSYHFMVLLNVGFLGCAGIVGCVCLSRALSRVLAGNPRTGPAAGIGDQADSLSAEPAPEGAEGAADPAAWIFQSWILVYGVVGAQMAWVLRPFIGTPDEPFTLFRARTGNVLQAVGGVLLRLLGIESGAGR